MEYPINEIEKLEDIQYLLTMGFFNWKQYGEVSVIVRDNLALFNYTAKAQYENRWNFFELVSRGLIIDRFTGEIVARPFDKFFNWGERGPLNRRPEGYIVSVTEKIDGSLGILYRKDNKCFIATRGAFDSEQAIWATDFLNKNYNLSDFLSGELSNLTLLFEIVYPGNRVVIDYGNKEGLILLAARNRITGEYLSFYPSLYNLSIKYGFETPRVYKFNDTIEIIEKTLQMDANEEGFVVEFSNGERFKFKGNKYLELHKLITGLSFKSTVRAIAAGTANYIKSQLPDEFIKQFEEWEREIYKKINEIKDKVEIAYNEAPKESRKYFALFVMDKYKELAHYLFAMLDGKDIVPMIYKMEFGDCSKE